ncbi:MAG: hypothetical protein EHM20_02560 [Alphaproteobacteria bacterium]|nr:MAG: hypothetical protein EHM20_02560 [Alphaproteobacteria bacterium]
MKNKLSFNNEEEIIINQKILLIGCFEINFLLFFIFNLSFFANYVVAETENTKEVWRNVISALREIHNPDSGKGSAIVAFTGPPETRTVIMDFEFNRDLSRSDMFLINDKGEKNKRDVAWSQSKDYAAVYNPSNVIIEPKEIRQFYRKFGYDFNPDTFLRWRSQSILGRLEKYNKSSGVLSFKKTENGILHLIAEYEDPNQRHYRVSSFDPAKGYRPVMIRDIIEFIKDRKYDINDTYSIEWQKYDSQWYIKWGKLESIYWSKDLNDLTRMSIEIAIQKFEPNINIDDNDFTIKALNISKGTRVIDKIKNREYKYEDANLVFIRDINNSPK